MNIKKVVFIGVTFFSLSPTAWSLIDIDVKGNSEWAFTTRLSAEVHANLNARVLCEEKERGVRVSSFRSKCRKQRNGYWFCETTVRCRVG